ncbi:MAG: glutathione S-transferase family protein [Kangiellaceae bacterium]|nr:glutathione S-transferase family protein [Kangiellaceae bacterium]
MLTLYGFGSSFGLADASPFVTKVDCYLRMAGIEYEINTTSDNLKKSPKGKLPYIVDQGLKIADSQAIIEHLVEKQNDILDSSLSPEQKAQAYLITKSLDENLYFALVYSRWLCDDTWPIIKQQFFGFLPLIVKNIVPALVRKGVARNLKGQGISRHSDKEILHICKMNFQALSDLLGDKTYMFGDKPSSLDAACYGHLEGFVLAEIDNPFNSLSREFPVLVSYCQNIKDTYYE